VTIPDNQTENECISFEEAVRQQREIYERLLKEIDDGLEAEAKYWNYYQSNEETDSE
jgi:hypothetical protein